MTTTTIRTNFEMFSKAGNKACQSLVSKAFKKIEGKKRVTQEEIELFMREGIKKIQAKFPEVYDTEPMYHMATEVRKKCEEIGYDYDIDRYSF